ncbi:MAG: hypothetical protein JWP12_3841 [Bacteroidetes bacterium]|nr:hypothetical protein [Bacteroidota bacterium]
MKHPYSLRLLLFFSILTAASQQISAQLSPIVDSVPMSDGRKLAADVYIPSGMTSGPVILIQTPYNRVYYRFLGLPLGISMALNSSNYIFVIADWRGFYGSAAAAYAGAPTTGVDGKSTVEWIAAQTWSNGKVGTWGPSALGDVQYKTAKENPPHLTCICPLVAGPQFEYEEYFPNGDLRTEYVEQLDALGFGLSATLMANPVHNTLWTYVENLNDYPSSIQVPCFMIGGWYDHNIEKMLPFFNEIRSSSPTAVRNEHRLLMGPWEHGGHSTASVGTANQGELTYANAAHWNDSLALMFFDYHLRTISNGWNTTPYIQYYQMGENTWQSTSAWPATGTSSTSFYFHQDGSLSTVIPSNTTDQLTFNYDPNDPSPTYGGPTLRADLKQGPWDQKDTVESRNDLLIFTTATLPQNAVLKGSAAVHMKIASDRLDTDFDIRLTDVYPDGRSMLVNDGTFRMRFRNGISAADTAVIVPNQIYDCVINLPNTAITFLTGHKIRVDVSSSNYPRFNRNMNTGAAMYPGNNMDVLVSPQIAANTVYTNATQTSYITLPLVGFTTGISELNESKIAIYPNPFTDALTIETGIQEECVVTVYNLIGEQIFSQKFTANTKINTSAFANGMYVVEVRSGDGVVNKKFVKQ